MKNRLFIRSRILIVVAVFFTLSSPISFSIENLAIMNPAGLSTVPPSSIQSGLIINRNPIDTSGNLVMTGNVRRGRHFRDIVPYDSTTSLRTGLGSSSLSSFSLSSFLRDSAGAEDFGHYTGKYRVQPYYLRSQTVTTTRPGYSGVFRPGTSINDRTLQGRYQAGMRGIGLEKQALSGKDTFASDLGFQGPPTPLEITSHSELPGFQRRFPTGQTQYSTSAEPRLIVQSIRELQLLNRSEVGIPPQDQQLMVERYQKQTQEPRARTQDSLLKIQDPGLKTQDLGLKTQDLGTALEQRFVLWSPEHKQSQVAEIVQSTKPDFSADVLTPALTPSQADTVVKGLAFQDRATLQKVTGWEPQVDEVKLGEHGRDLQDQRNRLGSDVLERIKQQLDDLTMSVDARMQAEADDARKDESTTEDKFSYRQGPAFDWSKMWRFDESTKAAPRFRVDELASVRAGSELIRAADGQKKSRFRFPETPNAGSYREKNSPLDELNKLSQADLSAKAKRIRGPHTSPESYSKAKFNQHIQAAQGHLKAGRYYAAADSFALASIYKLDPGEAGSDTAQADGLALCFAGRGHALFAAGEYISSALFLSRALKIAPEYVRTKIDLAAMLGGQDKLEGRIADIKEWLGRSGSGKLEFLLGYVYYRIGRLGPAKQTIEAAYTKMPQSPAVDAVKKAIDDAIAGR